MHCTSSLKFRMCYTKKLYLIHTPVQQVLKRSSTNYVRWWNSSPILQLADSWNMCEHNTWTAESRREGWDMYHSFSQNVYGDGIENWGHERNINIFSQQPYVNSLGYCKFPLVFLIDWSGIGREMTIQFYKVYFYIKMTRQKYFLTAEPETSSLKSP